MGPVGGDPGHWLQAAEKLGVGMLHQHCSGELACLDLAQRNCQVHDVSGSRWPRPLGAELLMVALNFE